MRYLELKRLREISAKGMIFGWQTLVSNNFLYNSSKTRKLIAYTINKTG